MPRRPSSGIIERVNGKGEKTYLARAWADRTRSTSKTFRTKREAQDWLNRQRVEIQDRGLVVGSRVTLAAFLEEWLTVWKKHELRPHVLLHYRANLQRYVTDPLGHLDANGQQVPESLRPKNGRAVADTLKKMRLGERPLRSLKPRDFQQLFNEIQRDGKGARAAQYLYAILREAMQKAVALRKLPVSPIDQVSRPRATPRRDRRILDELQVRAFLDAIEGHKHRALWILELLHAMRPGEALALRWRDIDLEGRALRVSATLRASGERGDTKTEAGMRTIALADTSVAAITAHRRAMGERSLQLVRPDALVFTTETGTPEHLNNVRRRFKKVIASLEKVGVAPDMTLYELRHSCASLLLSNGSPLPAVSAMIGHKSSRTTLQFYARALPADGERLAATMDGIASKSRISGSGA